MTNAKETDSVLVSKYIPLVRPGVCVVEDGTGRVIGAATASIVEGGLQVDFNLDRASPEVFDIEINPDRVSVDVGGWIANGKLELKFFLTTK